MHKFVAFDLEIAKILQGEDIKRWQELRPLGLSCAATCDQDRNVRHWYGVTPDGNYAPQMTRAECRELVRYLWESQCNGAPVVTWNGTSFDFNVLAEESGEPDLCADLAANHVDLMVAVVAVKGFRLGLKAAAKGCGSHKGAAGVESGEDAPMLWSSGQYDRALAYVGQDAIATADVTNWILKRGGFSWTTAKGSTAYFSLPSGVKSLNDMSVVRCLEWPEPDTSWMTDPPKRSDFLAWATKAA